MDYKKLAAAGMSAALLLSIGGSALAKAPGSAPPAREDTPISQSRPSDSGKTSGGAPKKGTAGLRSESDRVPESGHAKKAPDASGEQMNGKPSQKPTRKPNQKSETSSGGKQRKQSAQIEYDAANTLTQSSSGAAYRSTSNSENAVLVSGDKVTLTGVTVDKTGDASGDNADFYGINAAVLAKDGAELTIEGATITSNGAHAGDRQQVDADGGQLCVLAQRRHERHRPERPHALCGRRRVGEITTDPS